MLQQSLSLSLFLFSLNLSLLSVSATNTFINYECSQHCFTPMTPYDFNVNLLFTSLVDSSSVSNFNKFEICLPGSSQSDVVYGLFQCQGDFSFSDCKDCVASAVNQLKTMCPVSTFGTMQLEGCLVKYDNTPFFGVEDKREVFKRCGPSIDYNSDVLTNLDATLTYLIDGNGQYVRRGGHGSMHGMAQCVQDLSIIECGYCLSEASKRLKSECELSTWGDMYLGKCYIRYVDHGNDDNARNCDGNNNRRHDKKRKGNIKAKNIGRWFLTNMAGGVLGGVSGYVAVKDAVVTGAMWLFGCMWWGTVVDGGWGKDVKVGSGGDENKWEKNKK
ncbi:cysteine-rich repeat secretory protein 60-like [Cynara cardunculus var. scolymus]|uniref:cysteine-rich repeat secretory protein 60-like n=1 Tax=Cynara cardunculus var. scolymus TaxID=59895 RepID=UPI000D630CC1|nr:cysteine-rich repeat secretory protein 60-like [Cynara cardunculus var. scolymus]